jgi:riboflavin synthase alpha subunit
MRVALKLLLPSVLLTALTCNAALTFMGWQAPSNVDENREMAKKGYFTVDKGSVTVNGVSLTVCNPTSNTFQVAIIPYTFEHTNFCDIRVGSVVNIEFDILGKYIARLQQI